ncbi:Phytanoyl-CoA dioxygenase [Penicillium soppii]|uniref:Phytanoyl-CoA dioxygenase n=1 Tax=Penicillium soppii TaxID=69789 RepID=UPI002548CFC7|nr:Phytanoyl-CoA dioxygenase [Penicillium soppii]KAJ5881926.1 Phytanoyl-CoA dioxygenase [Penicillium soppii]
MNGQANGHPTVSSRLYTPSTPQFPEFKAIVSQTTQKSTYPLASEIVSNIPIYDLSALEQALSTTLLSALQDEWHHILHKGPGVYVLRQMYAPTKYAQTLSATNEAFNAIIAHERATLAKKGDHFAAGGTNDRIWNSFSKHALQDPSSFADYYSNPWLATVAESWLGPAYRVTAQVNAVHPGGAAQESHRDYHLGFQEEAACSRFPAATQLASQFLTLQGAVAHTDMPVESGPTRFLPFSQTFDSGYLAWRKPEFRQFFQENYVALPLELGDGVFFNPALFHAAGANEMDKENGFRRVANLLQISSAFGKPMEMVDSVPVVAKVWEFMRERYRVAGKVATVLDPEEYSAQQRELKALVQAVAEGYPFPTNLDQRPPAPSGMAPESEQDIVLRGVGGGLGDEGDCCCFGADAY